MVGDGCDIGEDTERDNKSNDSKIGAKMIQKNVLVCTWILGITTLFSCFVKESETDYGIVERERVVLRGKQVK